jgi:hypothetical protein
MRRESRRFSRLASVSRALDFGPAARAHAFALPGPLRNRAHVSSAHAATVRQATPHPPRRLRDERCAVVRPPSYRGGWKRHLVVG